MLTAVRRARAKIQLSGSPRSIGRAEEGVKLLGALAPHLPRCQRSMADQARALVEPRA